MVIGRTRHPAGKGGDEAGDLSFPLDFDASDDPSAEETKKKAAPADVPNAQDVGASASCALPATQGPNDLDVGTDFDISLFGFSPPTSEEESNAPSAKPYEPPPPSEPTAALHATPSSAPPEVPFTLSLGALEDGAGLTSIGEAQSAPATRPQEPQGLDDMSPLDLGTPGEGNAPEASSFAEIAKFVDATDGLLSLGSADEDKAPADAKAGSDTEPLAIDTGLRDVSLELGAAGDFESNPPPHGDVSLPEGPTSISSSRLELGESGEAFSVPAAAEKDQFVEEVLSLATGLSRVGGQDVGDGSEGGDAHAGDTGLADGGDSGFSSGGDSGFASEGTANFAEADSARGEGETLAEEARLQAEVAHARARSTLSAPSGGGSSVGSLEGDWGAKIATNVDQGRGGEPFSAAAHASISTKPSPAPAALRATLKSADTHPQAPAPHWQGGESGSSLSHTQATTPMNDAPVLAPLEKRLEAPVRAEATDPSQGPTPFHSGDSAGASTVPLFGQGNTGLGGIDIPASVLPGANVPSGAAAQAGVGPFGRAPILGEASSPLPAQEAPPSATPALGPMGSQAPKSPPVIGGIKKIIFRAKTGDAPTEGQAPTSGRPGMFGPPLAAGDHFGAQSRLPFPGAVSQAHQGAKTGFLTHLRRALSFGSGAHAKGGTRQAASGAGKARQRGVLMGLLGAAAVVGGGTYVLTDPELASVLGLEEVASSLGLGSATPHTNEGFGTAPNGAPPHAVSAPGDGAGVGNAGATESALPTEGSAGAQGEGGHQAGKRAEGFKAGAAAAIPRAMHEGPNAKHDPEITPTTMPGVPVGLPDATAKAHGPASLLLPEVESASVRAAARGMVFEAIPAFDFSAIGKNEMFFKGIEEALLRGDFVLAMRRFSATPPQKPEQPLEMLRARELLTRFYLGVSNVERATTVLKAECVGPDEENAHACIHHIRALVSAGRGIEARGWLQRARAARTGDWPKMAVVLSLMDTAERALASPTLANVMALVEHYLTQPNVTTEWHLQRSIWIVRAAARLTREERLALAKTILVGRRAEFDAVLTAPERSYNRGADPLLIPYLNYLASEFEYPPLDGPRVARGRGETDVSGASILFDALMRTFVEPSQNVLSSLVSLRGREAFAGAMRVMQINLLIQDNDMTSAAQTLQTLRDATAQGAPFRYEWALARARFATLTGSADLWIGSLRALLQAARAERGAERDFDYWIVQARLLRYLRKDPTFAIRRAGGLALTPRQKGLVEVEEAMVMKSLGRKAEAFAKLQAAVRAFPHHGPLLQAAAELAGQAGSDPTLFIELQASIPDAFLRRSQEFSPLSDMTLLKLLDKI